MKRIIQYLEKINDRIQRYAFERPQSMEKFLDLVRYDFLEKIFENPEAGAFYEKSFLYHLRLRDQRSFIRLMDSLFECIQKLGCILFRREFLERMQAELGSENRLLSPFRPILDEDITVEQFAAACGRRELFLKLGEAMLFYPDDDIPGHPTSAILKQHQSISFILSKIHFLNRKFLSKRQEVEVQKLTHALSSQIRELEGILIEEPKRLHSKEFWYLGHFIYLTRNLGTPLGLRIYPIGLNDAPKIKEAAQIVIDDLIYFSESSSLTSVQSDSQTIGDADSGNSEGVMRYRDIGYNLKKMEAWLLSNPSKKIEAALSTREGDKLYGKNLFKLLSSLGEALISANDKKNLKVALSGKLGIDSASSEDYFFGKNGKYGFSKPIEKVR